MEGGEYMPISMNKTLYINDIALSDYNIYCSSDTYLNAPQIDYTEYQIPARTGTLIQYNKRLNNVVRNFSCICRKDDAKDALDELKKLLYLNTGYVKLSSDYEPNFYQYGYFAEDLQIRYIINEDVAMFDLIFSCNPKKYKTTIDTIDFTWSSHINDEAYIILYSNDVYTMKYLCEQTNFEFPQNQKFIAFNPWLISQGATFSYIKINSLTINNVQQSNQACYLLEQHSSTDWTIKSFKVNEAVQIASSQHSGLVVYMPVDVGIDSNDFVVNFGLSTNGTSYTSYSPTGSIDVVDLQNDFCSSYLMKINCFINTEQQADNDVAELFEFDDGSAIYINLNAIVKDLDMFSSLTNFATRISGSNIYFEMIFDLLNSDFYLEKNNQIYSLNNYFVFENKNIESANAMIVLVDIFENPVGFGESFSSPSFVSSIECERWKL